MKQTLLLPISFLTIITTFACNDNGSDPKDEKGIKTDTHTALKPLVLDKLIGTWKSEDGQSFERWIQNDDGTYQTAVYSLNKADTTWKENGKVYPENGTWVYENRVIDQNDGKPIKFTSTKMDDRSIQFSNPAHDFPTDINYSVADPKNLNAFIIGPNNKGGKDTIRFNYTRHQQ